VPLTPDPAWSPEQLIDAALLAAPGPAWISALAALPLDLPPQARVLRLRAWARQTAWMHAAEQPLLTAITGPEWHDHTAPANSGGDRDHDWAREEIALALTLHPMTAAARLTKARELTGRLRPALDALAAGDLTPSHATILVEATLPLTDTQAAAVLARVLPQASDLPAGALKRAVTRAVLTAAPTDAADRHHAAAADRDVRARPLPDGMSLLTGVLPAPDAATILTALNALAAQRRRPRRDPHPRSVHCARATTSSRTNPAGPTPATPTDPAPPGPPRASPTPTPPPSYHWDHQADHHPPDDGGLATLTPPPNPAHPHHHWSHPSDKGSRRPQYAPAGSAASQSALPGIRRTLASPIRRASASSSASCRRRAWKSCRHDRSSTR